MNASVQGSSALVIKGLEKLPSKVDRALTTGLRRGLLHAAQVAQRQYLMGPRPEKLDQRTGRLLNSVVTEVESIPGRIIGRIGSNVTYAAFHEFGFHGVMNVRAHSRIIGNIGKGGKELPTRKAVKNDKGEVIYYKDIRPGFVRAGLSNFKSIEQVRAHTRHIDYEGRPFIRPAVGASLPVIVSEIKKELAKI